MVLVFMFWPSLDSALRLLVNPRDAPTVASVFESNHFAPKGLCWAPPQISSENYLETQSGSSAEDFVAKRPTVGFA